MKNKSIVTFIIKNVVFIFLCYLNCSTSQAQNQLYPANFDITSLNGSNGFRIPGVETSSQFGAETKFIGDINNDGLEDISISFSSAERGGVVGAGVVYIIFGSDTGFPSMFDVNILNGSNGFVFEGITQTEAIGLVVEGVGDINGDGIDDVVIGASRFSPGIVVLYGKSSPFNAVINRNDIGLSEGFTIITNSVSTQMNDIGALGDVNGDGRNDFILGKAIGGDAWIFFGRSSNFPISVDASWLDGMNGFRTSSYSNSLREAYLVGGTGDINNDGFNDIILGDWSITSGSSFIERTHVIFGRNSFDPLVDVTALDGNNGFVVDHTGGSFLAFTGTLGDINGDGIDDFFSETAAIFGKELTDPFPAYIPLSSVQDGTHGFILPGGLTSASIGDVNQDGINDFISVYRAESGPDANAYIVFGNTTGFPNPINESSLNGVNGFVIPGFRTSNIGRPVSGDGDFNGDGISDFIVGSPGEIPEGSTDRTGEAYVIFGGDHYAMPLNNGYPQAIDETISGFTLFVNGPETGTIHYAIFPGNFSGTVDYDDILNGVGATENGNFLMDVANTDVEEVISSLNASTTYDIYLFLEDGVGNQGQIYHINDVTTLSNSDTEDPTASDPSPILVECPADVPAPDIEVVIDEADNSGAPPIVAFVSDDTSVAGLIIRTYSVTDEAGNSINVTQTITINDTTDPTASDPASISVQCATDVPAPDNTVVLDASDNCTINPIVAFVNDDTSIVGLVTRTYSVSDEAGNSINVIQTIRINDTTDPTASDPASISVQCITDVPSPDITVVLDASDNCTINPIVAFVNDDTSVAGVVSRTYSVTDEAGNSINVTQTITINDTTDPTASDPVSISVQCITDIPAPDIMVVLDASDNCTTNPIVAFVSDDRSVAGVVSRTYSVSDEAGNSINVTQIITINDTTDPTATDPISISVQCVTDVPAPDITVVLDASDNCTINPIVAFVSDDTSVAGVVSRTYSVSDEAGNSINVIQTIRINDTTDPTASDPVSISVQCITDVPSPDITVVLDASDNCTINPIVAFVSDDTSVAGVVSRTYSVSDEAGNSINVTQIITINDTTNPTASDPVSISVQCITDIPAPDIMVVLDASDNCTINPIVAFVNDDTSVAGVVSRTYSVSDEVGNSINVTQTITINDTTDPTATDPVSISVQCITDVPAPDIMVVLDASDNCTINPIVAFVNDDTSVAGVVSRTYSVSDEAGNSINVIQTIRINDTTDPTASDPVSISVQCITDVPSPDITVVLDASDNCTINPIVAFVNDDTSVAGVVSRTYSVSDEAGNSINVTQIITIDDSQVPDIACPGNQILTIGSLIPDYSDRITVVDNCDINVSVEQIPSVGTAFVDGMTIQFIATDSSGNSNSCSFVITASSDIEAPMIVCLSDQVLSCNAQIISDYRSEIRVTDDKDPNPTVTQLPAPGTEFIDGMEVTITATDASGNSSDCSFRLDIDTVSIEAGDDEEITEGEEVQLNAEMSDSGTIVWFPSIGLTDVTISNPIASPTETITYTVTFTSDEGCIVEDMITVFVEQLPEDETKYGFSPDGDGINEFWEIDGIENYPNNKVLIYNRWGDLVFEIDSYNNTSRVFNGIANRKRNLGADKLPEGTYFFDIKTQGSNNFRKSTGFLVLKR